MYQDNSTVEGVIFNILSYHGKAPGLGGWHEHFVATSSPCESGSMSVAGVWWCCGRHGFVWRAPTTDSVLVDFVCFWSSGSILLTDDLLLDTYCNCIHTQSLYIFLYLIFIISLFWFYALTYVFWARKEESWEKKRNGIECSDIRRIGSWIFESWRYTLGLLAEWAEWAEDDDGEVSLYVLVQLRLLSYHNGIIYDMSCGGAVFLFRLTHRRTNVEEEVENELRGPPWRAPENHGKTPFRGLFPLFFRDSEMLLFGWRTTVLDLSWFMDKRLQRWVIFISFFCEVGW